MPASSYLFAHSVEVLCTDILCAGKLLVLGCVFGMEEPLLRMAALLSVQSPFLRLGTGGGGGGGREAGDEAEAR